LKFGLCKFIKKQKHVSKHKSIPFMSLWFIKGRSQTRVSPFKGTSAETVRRNLLKVHFSEWKKNCRWLCFRAFLQSKSECL